MARATDDDPPAPTDAAGELLGLLRQWRDTHPDRATGRPLRGKDLAARAGISEAYVSEIFKGHKVPSADVAADLVQAIRPDQDRQRQARRLAERAAIDREATPSRPRSRTDALPHSAVDFVGRQDAVRALTDRLAAGRDATTVHVVDGMPGVGKTELALRVARQVAGHFPGGLAFLDLAGYSPGLEPLATDEALRVLLAQRGVAAGEIRHESGLRALWHAECSKGPLLVVLDNARDRDQVAPLLPTARGCAALVTSRRKLIGLPGSVPYSLDLPDLDEATRMLRPATGEAGDVRRVVDELCGRLPLAIAIASSVLAHRPGYRIADLAVDLDAERRNLERLGEDDDALHVAVHASIRLSTRVLPGDLLAAFRACGWHPGPEVTEPALAAMLVQLDASRRFVRPTAAERDRVRRALRALADRNLIRQQTADGTRYRMHDLVRASARLDQGPGDAEPREAALRNLTLATVVTLERVEAWRFGGSEHVPASRPEQDAPLCTPASRAAATAWVQLERENLLALIDATGVMSALMSGLLAPHLRDCGYLADAWHCYEDAERGYGALGADAQRAHAIRGLAHVALLDSDYDTARQQYQRARAISRRARDKGGQGLAHRGLGAVAYALDEYDTAATHLHQAVTLLAEQVALGANQYILRDYAVALADLGHVEKARDDLDQAEALLTAAAEQHAMVGDVCAWHQVGTSLAEVRWRRGDLAGASARLDAVLASLPECGDPRCEADALWQLVQLRNAAGDSDTAVAAAERVLDLDQAHGTPFRRGRALLALADAQRIAGRLDEARNGFDEALRQCDQVQDRDGVAQAHLGLGDVAADAGEPDPARRHWELARETAAAIGLKFVLDKARARLASSQALP